MNPSCGWINFKCFNQPNPKCSKSSWNSDYFSWYHQTLLMHACMFFIHLSHYSCTMLGLCVIFRHKKARLMAVQQHEIGVACKTTLHLPPSLPACHPESHHLLNSEVHGVWVQHYGSFPYRAYWHCMCVCVCERDNETDGQSKYNLRPWQDDNSVMKSAGHVSRYI